MSNKRAMIRRAFADFLIGKTPAGDKVFTSRVRTFSDIELPVINIRAERESAEIFNQAPRIYKRTLEIYIEVTARAKQNVDDVLDSLMAGIELLIDSEDLFAPLDIEVSEIEFKESSILLQGQDATQLSGVGSLRYDVEYYTTAGAQATGLMDYTSIFADFNDGEIQAEFNIPQ